MNRGQMIKTLENYCTLNVAQLDENIVKCLYCGVKNPAGEAFCEACGAALP